MNILLRLLGLPSIEKAKREYELLCGEGSALRDGLTVMAGTALFWGAVLSIAFMVEG